jgi:hypothetical protein
MISLILIMCLATGAPQGVCLAEIDFNTKFDVPLWATLVWQDHAAHIVASEARGVPQADIVVACTLIRDGGSLSRWFGYGPPDKADRKAVEDALFTDACESVPHYRYVGNFKDAQYWRWLGMVGEGSVDLYLGLGGQAVVGVP